jgi:hypothetical protein
VQYVEQALVLVMQLVTVCPCEVTYSSEQPAQGVMVVYVVHSEVGLAVTVTVVTAAQVSSASFVGAFDGDDVTYDVALVFDVTVVSQYVQVGLDCRNSSHPSVGET